jgi:hypothetical protein
VVDENDGNVVATDNDPVETHSSRTPGSVTINSYRVYPVTQNYYGPPTAALEVANAFTNNAEADDIDTQVELVDATTGEPTPPKRSHRTSWCPAAIQGR